MKDKKIIIAGSHGATTAISIIEEILERKINCKIYFLGNIWANENKNSHSLEYQSLPGLGVNFLNVNSGKIENKLTIYAFSSLLKLPFGFLRTEMFIRKIRPNLLVSLGGASGAMASLWAWLYKIPVVIHEPTASAGRANLFSARFAKIIALSRNSSIRYFKNKNYEVTGNPLSKEILKYLDDRPRNLPKTILITGGSRGSKWINNAVKPLIKKLTTKYKIIHQTGFIDFQKFKNISDTNYIVFPQVSHSLMARYIAKSDLVISRAGANTVSELLALKKPSILIPIPWSFLNEQGENANFLAKFGVTKIIPQNLLNPEILLTTINEVVSNYRSIMENFKSVKSPDIFASQKVTFIIQKHLE